MGYMEILSLLSVDNGQSVWNVYAIASLTSVGLCTLASVRPLPRVDDLDVMPGGDLFLNRDTNHGNGRRM